MVCKNLTTPPPSCQQQATNQSSRLINVSLLKKKSGTASNPHNRKGGAGRSSTNQAVQYACHTSLIDDSHDE